MWGPPPIQPVVYQRYIVHEWAVVFQAFSLDGKCAFVELSDGNIVLRVPTMLQCSRPFRQRDCVD